MCAATIRALASISKGILNELADHFANDGDPRIRLIFLNYLDASDDLVTQPAKSDSDPGVRAEAVRRFAGERPELATIALGDPDESVAAIALEFFTGCLQRRFARKFAGVDDDGRSEVRRQRRPRSGLV